ncbi:MAG: MFS transporter [Isosphaeraceae bacterium]
MARNHGELRLARVALGAGEAVLGALAPTILVDLFPRSWRGRVLGAFCLALPLGGALGTAVGGYFAARSSWSQAMFALALPGLIASAAVFLLPDPLRGATEPVAPERVAEHQKAGPTQEDYIDMMVNSSFTYSVFGMAFFTFAMAGMAAWLPRFLTVQKGFPIESVWRLGWVTLASSTLGIVLGGWLGDLLSRRSGRAYFMLSGLAMLGSIPCLIAAVYGGSERVVFGSLFLTVTLMFIHAGPCLAVVANVVAPNMRGVGYAVALFSVHLFGDLWSPGLMGWVSDTFGRRDAMSTPFGSALAAVGAMPKGLPGGPPENLTAAMLVVVPALALSGGVLLAGARHLPRESALMLANLKASPKRKAPARPAR